MSRDDDESTYACVLREIGQLHTDAVDSAINTRKVRMLAVLVQNLDRTRPHPRWVECLRELRVILNSS